MAAQIAQQKVVETVAKAKDALTIQALRKSFRLDKEEVKPPEPVLPSPQQNLRRTGKWKEALSIYLYQLLATDICLALYDSQQEHYGSFLSAFCGRVWSHLVRSASFIHAPRVLLLLDNLHPLLPIQGGKGLNTVEPVQ